MNIRVPAIAAFAAMTLAAAGSAAAGQHTETGYIMSVKANNVGSYCFLDLGKSPNKDSIQKGKWYCGYPEGQNILGIAKMAMGLRIKVAVTFEGNGAEYKPVYAVETLQ